jgi:5'-methylthioadenosine phosphorylase
MSRVVVGIIGGTGLGEALGTLGQGEVREVETPFGRPSGPITLTEVAGVPVALLSRHGEGHLLNPSQVPYRANIYALKSLGVTHVVASGAVGSLREEVAPKHLVIPDQVIDKTFRRPSTFFDDLAVHVELAAPFCGGLRNALVKGGAGFPGPVRIHQGGTYVCMEGPQFSTRAESELHRSWGASLIGMTVMPEAKLAREAELCYALVALPTDYDCWRPHPTVLDQARLIEEILGNVKAATQNAIELIRRSMPHVAALAEKPCSCQSALSLAIWSDKSKLTPETRQRLKLLLEKYLG